ncbi:hypothetical protein [Ferrimonas senticii]|uniref:hypothetical protein n=1 Tax=Ferrimonas senticii TaxID=394566 RepID=UPI00041FDC1D|nr:hypothetical protein [Ferrimonas senticii]
MTQTVRSIFTRANEPQSTSTMAPVQLRFLLRKLSLRRNQIVVVIGTPELDAVRQVAESVGVDGRVSVLLTEAQLAQRGEYLAQVTQLAEQRPQVSVGKLGPTLESQRADALIVLPDRLMPPYQPLLEQAWRRLLSGGRLMLVLPAGEQYGQRLHELIEAASKQGFVSRFRRICEKHTAWVGVKYCPKG